MESQLGSHGFVIVGLYVLALLGIGWFCGTRVKTLDDFIVAGRSMNRWQIGFSIVATWVSGTTLLAFPAMGYKNGLAIYFFGSGASLASGLWVGFYVVPEMRKRGLMTVPELFEQWFGRKHRVVAMLAVWSRELANIGSSLVAIGISISFMTLLSYQEAVVLGAAITVMYLLLGGQRAVIVTDCLQNIIVVSLTITIFVIVLQRIGGWTSFTAELADHHKSVTSGYPLSNLLAWLVMGIFQALPYQALIQRGLSARNVEEARAGFLIGGVLGAAWYACLPVLGMLAWAAYGSNEEDVDRIFLVMASREFPPLVYALLVVMYLGAVMSTLDSVLMSVSSNFVVDIYQRSINSECTTRQAVAASRVCIMLALGIGIVAAFLFPVMLELLWIGTRVMVAGLGPVIAALVLYPSARRAPRSTLSAMILGMASTAIAFLLTGGAGDSVVVLWSFDPIYVGLTVNIVVLIAGTSYEIRHTVPAGLDDHRSVAMGRFKPYWVLALILGGEFLYYLVWVQALNL